MEEAKIVSENLFISLKGKANIWNSYLKLMKQDF